MLRKMKGITISRVSKDLGLSKDYLKELENSKKVLWVHNEKFKLKFDDEDLERIYYYYMKALNSNKLKQGLTAR